ncbi:PP2C family protein-serine/threonine phosphatase [Herbidospora mongoliensis]|uniref:PP2C family protein-serine/threonine phosphatase n=1 Tax=Herbidospora mongoliensis TaxID=688067 RepID=UPI0008350E5B|nr:SpoIIE family protein phosphatase [Herbidospora mongoliensis]
MPALSHGLPDLVTLLLIEDDAEDAFLVEELLADSQKPPKIIWARTLAEGRDRFTTEVTCVLVDLSLPDAIGLEAVRQVTAMAPDTAVIVLTGLNDVQIAVDAVAAGAEDYLVKQEVDGNMLARAIRYAIERKRGDLAERELVEQRVLREETARLEHGLLPTPVLRTDALVHQSTYLPGRQEGLLAGDFWDTLQTADGAVHVLVGDVCGHGPDEAALGAALRIAWRTLTLAGLDGNDVLRTMDAVLRLERGSPEIFTTLVTATIAPDLNSARLYVVGHPPPLVILGDDVDVVTETPSGPPIGIFPEMDWIPVDIALDRPWTLLFFTDGLIEATVGDGRDLLGTDGLIRLVREQGGVFLDQLIEQVKTMHADALTDDLAAVALSRR